MVYLINKFVPLDKAKISILDRGFLYGDGVFETMRAYEGVVFHLEKHIGRLFKSLKMLRIRPGIDKPKMQKIVYKLLDKNKLKDAYIKIIVTRGKSTGLLIPPETRPATLAVYALPYKWHPGNIYKRGIKVFLARPGCNEKSPAAGKKTLNYLDNILCRYEAKKRRFDDAILINTKGFVSEATSSNIFLVKEEKLFTPCLESGCLPGITRDEIIRLAKRFWHGINEGFIKTDTLYGADEVFLTNSLAEIVPVVRIGNHVIGRGAPGPVTEKLRGLFRDSVNRYRAKWKIDKKSFL
ncbi:MAG: aminotransferase class IV [Candidatus Omnitrophota bacterium]|nr:MAG: aminotransferase class IV [Candidatus Omnitrophota bacterium]